MTPHYAQRLDRVVRGVLGPVLRDYAKGVLDREDVDERGRRLANAIRQGFHEPPRVEAARACDDCRKYIPIDQIAVIAGRGFCAGCAPRHRPKRPVGT